MLNTQILRLSNNQKESAVESVDVSGVEKFTVELFISSVFVFSSLQNLGLLQL